MASKGQVESLTEEAICPICLDFFTDPVILECGHNFCRSCITRCWEREERNSCPECREEFADRTLRVNRALANLSEKARKLNLNPKEKEKKLHCEKHEEELKLFCETDKTLICLICATAREHKSHNFTPVNEAAEIYKGRVKSSLDSLTKKKSDFEEMEQQQKEKISGVQEQSHSLQSQITSHFAELRRILTEKEQRALRDLREEEERILNPMEKNLREIQENLNSIQEEISKLQEQMDQQENITFLMEEARRKRRISDDAQTLSVTDGALLVEKFYHPYLFDIALGEAFDGINRVSVTLDVETAHPEFEVSEDRKSVRLTGTRRNLPDTGKRFTDRHCVLGSEGFTSGKHYWEVEVTGNQVWGLGVAAESVKRKGKFTRSPETGFWIIARVDDVLWVFTSPVSRLPAGPIPGRVGVYLSYESGTVSFYNAETKSHLHTFTGNKFTGKLYPFFWNGYENEWLRICSGSAPGLQTGRVRDRRQESISLNSLIRKLKLLNCLNNHGFDDSYLKQNLVAFASDGHKEDGVWSRSSQPQDISAGTPQDRVLDPNTLSCFLNDLLSIVRSEVGMVTDDDTMFSTICHPSGNEAAHNTNAARPGQYPGLG
ncbi:E3 ubiquitin-protein ligase TRIM39-like [Hemitrygon akajei]|uniref:E3 ubiquitin-protein ligase TRIM39-like n=1 Tax=Hemitrygon akajei TaxID=2704970 RepID=UPI003BF971CC